MKMKYVFKLIITFLMLLIGEIFLLILVNLIPQKYIESNVKQASSVFNKEGNFHALGINESFILDNWTDAVMVNTAYSVDSEKRSFISILFGFVVVQYRKV